MLLVPSTQMKLKVNRKQHVDKENDSENQQQLLHIQLKGSK